MNLRALFLRLLFLTAFLIFCSCSNFGDARASCGAATPTYIYFTKIAPDLSYPNNWAMDTSEGFTFEHAKWDDLFIREPGGTVLNRYPTIYVSLLESHFEESELDCWADNGDQVAAYWKGSRKNSGVGTFYKHLGKFRKRRGHALTVRIDPQMPEKKGSLESIQLEEMSEDLKITLNFLSLAAKRNKTYCPIGTQEYWEELPQCQPQTLLTVLENGLPGAHSIISDIKLSGPIEIRDLKNAQYHWVVGKLQRGVNHEEDGVFYSCRFLNVIRHDGVMVELFFKRLRQDIFFPYGKLDKNDITKFRDQMYEGLEKCPVT